MHTELMVPGLGERIEKVQVSRVLVAAGAQVRVGTPLLEVEADKAVLEIPAAAAGMVRQVLASAGDVLKVGQAFAVLDTEAAAPAPAPDPSAGDIVPPAAAAPPVLPAPTATAVVAPVAVRDALPATPHVPAAPSVRRFAREIGIDVDAVKGSGPHGRVSSDDVKRHAREQHTARHEPGAAAGAPPLPDFAVWGGVHRETMTGIRWATAVQVTRAWHAMPRVTHVDAADITELEVLRQRYKPRAAAAGGNLTMAVMVVKVVAEALRKFPKFNASIDMASRQIVYKDYVNIGIAVATERGLLVPVLRAADRKNMVQLAGEIDRVAKRCREGKITAAELQGGTFTVTNLGSIGGSWFTPIINWPEVAILGLGRAAEEVVLRDRQPVARTRLPLSLSYDHRLIDGADAAHFVRWLAEAIEQPLLLSLEGGPP